MITTIMVSRQGGMTKMAADEHAFLRHCLAYQARIDGLLAWMRCDPRIHAEWVTV